MPRNGKPGAVGPPTKKNAAAIERALDIARTGLPLHFVAQAAGITRETLQQWRNGDPEFNAAIESARLESVLKRWKDIQKIAQGTKNSAPNWQAIAWSLERSFPNEFARPEVQLGVQINNQQTVNNTLVISVEDAERLEKRAKKQTAEIDALLEARNAKNRARDEANNLPPLGNESRTIEAEVVRSPIVLPPEPQRTASWWRQLSRGEGMRTITAQAAIFVIEVITVKVFGLQRASMMELEFDQEQPKLRDVHAAIQQLCGPRGWEALVELGEH
jgi:hypothetical protein